MHKSRVWILLGALLGPCVHICHADDIAPIREFSTADLQDIACLAQLANAHVSQLPRVVAALGGEPIVAPGFQERVSGLAFPEMARHARPETHLAFYRGEPGIALEISRIERADPMVTMSNLILRSPFPGLLPPPPLEYTAKEVSVFWNKLQEGQRRKWFTGSVQAAAIRWIIFGHLHLIRDMEGRHAALIDKKRSQDDPEVIASGRRIQTAYHQLVYQYYILWSDHFFNKHGFIEDDLRHFEDILCEVLTKWLALLGERTDLTKISFGDQSLRMVRVIPNRETPLGKAMAVLQERIGSADTEIGVVPAFLVRMNADGGLASGNFFGLTLGKLLLLHKDPTQVTSSVQAVRMVRRMLKTTPSAFHGDFIANSGDQVMHPGFRLHDVLGSIASAKSYLDPLRAANDDAQKRNLAFNVGQILETVQRASAISVKNLRGIAPLLTHKFPQSGDWQAEVSRVDGDRTDPEDERVVVSVRISAAGAPRLVFIVDPEDEGKEDSSPSSIAVFSANPRAGGMGFRVPLVGKAIEPLWSVLKPKLLASVAAPENKQLDEEAKDAIVLILRAVRSQVEVGAVAHAVTNDNINALIDTAVAYLEDGLPAKYQQLIQELEELEDYAIDRLTMRTTSPRNGYLLPEPDIAYAPTRAIFRNQWVTSPSSVLVEEISVDAVTTDLESRGYTVQNHSKHNFGYDLSAVGTQGQRPLHIEVKGVNLQQGQPRFAMTRPEIEYAMRPVENRDYLLALVVITADGQRAIYYRSGLQGLGGPLESESAREFSLQRLLNEYSQPSQTTLARPLALP